LLFQSVTMSIALRSRRRPVVFSAARALWLACLGLAAFGCAGPGWPDEPGVPVTVSRARNLDAEEAFVDDLTTLRLGEAVPEPIVTPALQHAIRTIAERLQTGSLSAEQARQISAAWGRAVYHRDVDAWALDCSAGRKMWVPPALIDRPTVVISYASAQFRPRSAAADQCATLVVSARGSDAVHMNLSQL